VADYETYTKLMPSLTVFTVDQYRWAKVAVGSRVWSSGGDDTLIPVMDLLNHFQPMIHLSHGWSDDGTNYVTTQNVSEGSQLYFHYGPRGQHDWLQWYGFTAPENQEFNYMGIYLRLPENDKRHQQKAEVIGYSEFWCDFTLIYDMNDGASSRACYTFSRMATYEGKNITAVAINPDPFSLSHEIKAITFLAQVCNETLNKYPTTYEEDLNILKNKDLISTNFNYYNALILRSEEKEILRFPLELLHLLQELEIELEGISEKKERSEAAKKWIDTRLKGHSQWVRKYFEAIIPVLSKNGFK